MKIFTIIAILLLILLSCYQYRARYVPREKPAPIYVQIPNMKDIRQDTIVTSGGTYMARISGDNKTVSHAVANSIRSYLLGKGITGEYKISRETLYGVVNSIPRRSFKSKNRNMVDIGEKFRFRMPKYILLNRNGFAEYYIYHKRVYGIDKLREVLTIRWLKAYEVNFFDCSEMSAFLEYWLENKGFNTDIVSDRSHSWVIVETEPGIWTHVESTSSAPYVINERPYNDRYKDIFQAIKSSPADYDWWNSVKPGEYIIGRK